jgi:mannose-1-phosphate guanylyltransferase
MKALYPTLGVDYIKLGDRVESNPEFEIYKSEAFIKRTDDYAKTKELIENYHITIHCNHTCWYPELMLEAYKQFHPAWYASLVQIRDLFAKSAPDSDIENSYAQMPKGSTEEVIEHVLKDGYVVLLPYKWTDIGTWDSVYQHFAQNNENYSDGKLVSINSKGSFVKTCSNSSKIVVVSDIDNLVVIDTEDALLVLPRDKADSIQKIQKELRLKNLESYL